MGNNFVPSEPRHSRKECGIHGTKLIESPREHYAPTGFLFPSRLDKSPDSELLLFAAAQRCERLLENVIRYAPPLRDPFRLIKRPVDAEVNSALAIFFLGLG